MEKHATYNKYLSGEIIYSGMGWHYKKNTQNQSNW